MPSPATLDLVERAIREGRRVAFWRGGTEFVMVPVRLDTSGRDALVGRMSMTGENMTFLLHELNGITLVE